MPNPEENMPKWDVALASLASETFRLKGQALDLEDFHRMAKQHAIRLDDIMETLFRLVIDGQWTYTDSNGQPQTLTQETLDKLYVKRRLSEEDLNVFDGGWRPA